MRSGGSLPGNVLHANAVDEQSSTVNIARQRWGAQPTEPRFRHHEHSPDHGRGVGDLLEAFRRVRAKPKRRERGLDRVGRPQVMPVRLREVVERDDAVAVPIKQARSILKYLLGAPLRELLLQALAV